MELFSLEELSDEELVKLVLRQQSERIKTKNIRDIVSATREELGLTNVAYDRLMAGIELGKRVSEPLVDYESPITSTQRAVEFCRSRFHRLMMEGMQEQFHVVFLNTKHKVTGTKLITQGTLDASLVHPREVYAPAIEKRCSAILSVHNHPSGNGEPSREDVAVCKKLDDVGNILGINHLDSIIVARDGCVSIRESH